MLCDATAFTNLPSISFPAHTTESESGSTTTAQPADPNSVNISQIYADGKWHTLVVDLSAVTKPNFVKDHYSASTDGSYKALFLRWDFFSGYMNTDDYIDIAYVGMDSDLTAIAKLNSDLDHIVLWEGDDLYHVDIETGEKMTPGGNVPEFFVHPESVFKKSALPYAGHIDYLNGMKISTGSNSAGEVAVYRYLNSTIAGPTVENRAHESGTYLCFAGWTAVQGGAIGYKWSVDGGKTWQDVALYGRNDIGTAGPDILAAASDRVGGGYSFTEADAANGAFQGAPAPNPTGIGVDLTAYEGKTVTLILAAVPANDPTTLCPIICVMGVTVGE